MHEEALMRDLVRAVEEVARRESASRITCVRVRVGALSHLSAAGLTRRWPLAVRGTSAEAARLEVEVGVDPAAPDADRVVLASVDVPDGATREADPTGR